MTQFQQQSGIRTILAASGPVGTIREDCAIHVYRIAQEALSNVSRHSGSLEAWVRLTADGQDLELVVEDRGRGMLIEETGAQRGLGLVSMRERAELMGGQIQFRPSREGGLVVCLTVPSCLEAASAARTEGAA